MRTLIVSLLLIQVHARAQYAGCMDPSATNYNPAVLFNDGTCMFDPNQGCDSFNCPDNLLSTVYWCQDQPLTLHSGFQRGTYFDGNDDWILTENAAVIGTQQLTVSFWAQSDHAGRMDVFTQSCGSDCGPDLRLGFNTPQCNRVGPSFKSPAHFATWPFNSADGNWHHYTFVFGENDNFSYSNIQVYIDGQHWTSYPSEFSFCGHNWGGWTYNPADHPVRIGFGDPLGGFFRGYLDDLMLWGSALNESQVDSLFQQIPLQSTGEELLSFWPLDRKSDGLFLDVVGGNHGQAMGGIGDEVLDNNYVPGVSIWSNGSTFPEITIQPNASMSISVFSESVSGSQCEESTWIEIAPGTHQDSDGDGWCDLWEVQGCMDPDACNYNEAATDPGSCVYPILGNDCSAGSIACGEGQIWNQSTQTCISPSSFDSNGDGCVTSSDLLDMLLVFDTCQD